MNTYTTKKSASRAATRFNMDGLIRSLYDNGYGLPEIAARLGKAYTAISDSLKRTARLADGPGF